MLQLGLFFFYLCPWIEISGESATADRMACLGYPASLLWAFPFYIAVSLSLLATGRLRLQSLVAVLFSSGCLASAALLYLWFPGVLSKTLKWGAASAAVTLVVMFVTGVFLLLRRSRDNSTR